MKRSSIRMLRLAALCAVASVAVYGGAACSSTPGTPGTGGAGGEENKEIADVIYEAETNDEALEALLATTPAANPAKVAVFDAPSDGAALPSSPIPTFSWSVKPGTGGGARAPMPPTTTRLALGDFGAREHRAWPGREHLRPLLDLLGSERSASAHGAPLNGAGYFLVFTTKANDKLLRVFTAKTTYTPDDAAWAKLKSAEGSIAASLLMGVFDNNDVAADGGPFAGPAISFTVTP